MPPLLSTSGPDSGLYLSVRTGGAFTFVASPNEPSGRMSFARSGRTRPRLIRMLSRFIGSSNPWQRYVAGAASARAGAEAAAAARTRAQTRLDTARVAVRNIGN